MQHATNCVAKYVHPNTAGKIENKSFLSLPGMESTNMKYSRCPAAYLIPTMYT